MSPGTLDAAMADLQATLDPRSGWTFAALRSDHGGWRAEFLQPVHTIEGMTQIIVYGPEAGSAIEALRGLAAKLRADREIPG